MSASARTSEYNIYIRRDSRFSATYQYKVLLCKRKHSNNSISSEVSVAETARARHFYAGDRRFAARLKRFFLFFGFLFFFINYVQRIYRTPVN